MNQPAAFKYQNLVSLCLLSIISARIWAFIANSLIYALAALEVFQSMVQAIQPNQRRFKSRIYPALKELWYGKLEFINLVRSVAITKEYRKQNELYGLLLDVLVQPYFILVNLDNNKCYIGEPTFINNQFHNPSDQFIRLQLYASGYRNNKQQLILQHFYSEEADSLKIGVNQIVINLDKVHSVSYFDPLLYQQHLQLRQKESQIKQTPMEVI